MFHDDLRITVEAFQKVYQLSGLGGGVTDLKRFRHHNANGRGTATMLFPLETSIPTAFIRHAPVNRFTMDKVIFPIADSIYLLTRTLRFPGGSTCTNRTLRMRGWLTD